MKKLMTMVLALALACSLTACGNSKKATKSSHRDDDSKPTVSETNTVEECLTAVLNARSAAELDGWITDNFDGYYEQMKGHFPADDYVVSVEKLGEFQEREVYTFTITEAGKSDAPVSGVEVFKKDGTQYRVETNQEFIGKLVEECTCRTCDGSGKLVTSNHVCGVCAGTGVQYYPNTYYDAATNMWMGETRACSGCAGAGTLGGAASECPTCHGHGLAFH